MKKNEAVSCHVCQSDRALLISTKDRGEDSEIKCPTCGEYWITRSARRIPETLEQKAKLAAWIRQYNLFYKKTPELHGGNIETIIENIPSYSPSEKQLILLRALKQMSKYPGDKIQMTAENDFPLAWANNKDEFTFYLETIKSRAFIRLEFTMQHLTATILHEGWEFLDRYGDLPAFQNQVFIAMSFSDALEHAWENGIKPAVEKCGYNPYRIDKTHHIERIDAKIITEIKNSKFLIADVTEQKPGVYYEAGFAQGLNRPVIWCVRRDDLDKVHFDTNTFNHIVWVSSEELCEQLYYRICAVIGENKITNNWTSQKLPRSTLSFVSLYPPLYCERVYCLLGRARAGRPDAVPTLEWNSNS